MNTMVTRFIRHPIVSASSAETGAPVPSLEATVPTPTSADAKPRRERTHYLYLAVLAAVVLGVIVGFAAPGFAKSLTWLGTGFVNLIKMMISPIIFCTIVIGIGSVAKAAKVGKVGLLAIGYFLAMSTVALVIGLVVGNLLHPGSGLHLDPASAAKAHQQATGSQGPTDFILGIIPASLLSGLTSGSVLQTLLIALLVGFGLQKLGPAGQPILRGIEHVQKLV